MAFPSRIISISAIQAYHSRERKLFSRMVLGLDMDPSRSMEIIAFWLWLEDQEKTDVIDHINTFSDAKLQTAASMGQDFISALRLDTPPDQLTVDFHRNAVNGVKFYLNSVCKKAFEDILKRAEEEMKLRQMEILFRRMSLTYMESLPHSMDLSLAMHSVRNQPYVPHGEGSSRSTCARLQPVDILDIEREIRSGYPFNLSMLGNRPSSPQLSQTGHVLPMMGQHINTEMVLRNPYEAQAEAWQRQIRNIPVEERTLFVTFSNGYPLTKEELYSFFMSHYGDVELVNVQKPKEGKPPQYAYVSFSRLETLLCVLNGSEKVKFVTKGKHLWARRYIPKRSQYGEVLCAPGALDEHGSSRLREM